MANNLTLTLEDDDWAEVQAMAALDGLSPEDWVARAVTAALAVPGLREGGTPFDAQARGDAFVDTRTPEDLAFQHAASLAALEEYDRTGEHITFEDWAAEFRADVKARLATR